MRSVPIQQASITLRRWAAEDDHFVAGLAEEEFAEYGTRPAEYLLRVTHRAGVHSWVAQQGEVPMGLVVLAQEAQAWWVLAVAVARQAQARGVGTRLMQVAEQYAAANGAQQLGLFTADSNLAALDLFLRRGFRIVARRPR